MKSINVLSCFDGISCGQIALNRAGIKYKSYYASEVNKKCIKITQHHYPNTIQLGDIRNIKGESLPHIDLLLGGFCCQSFSHAGKKLNFNDPRGMLFFEYARLLKETQSSYFLAENVVMKKEWQDIISNILGVEPILLNSRLVSAQERKRLYWTNIPVFNLPKDKNISFKDISRDNWIAGGMRGRRLNPITLKREDYNYTIHLNQYIESRMDNKTNCLTTLPKDNVATDIFHKRTLKTNCNYRYLTPNEYEALQTIPINYTKVEKIGDFDRKTMLANAWTVDIITYLLNNIFLI